MIYQLLKRKGHVSISAHKNIIGLVILMSTAAFIICLHFYCFSHDRQSRHITFALNITQYVVVKKKYISDICFHTGSNVNNMYAFKFNEKQKIPHLRNSSKNPMEKS